jgi:hypothetical protein
MPKDYKIALQRLAEEKKIEELIYHGKDRWI